MPWSSARFTGSRKAPHHVSKFVGAGATTVLYQYVMLSGTAPEIKGACMEGSASSGSNGGVPGIWNWLASVACSLEVVNDDIYSGQMRQSDLLVVQVAGLRGVKELAVTQLSRWRSLARRSNKPGQYAHRVRVATGLRDMAGLLIDRIIGRRNYERELILVMCGLEERRVRPLVI